MPELLEIEMYRRGAGALVGRTVEAVRAPDDWYLKGIDAASLTAAVPGSAITGLDRIGKLLILETSGASLGLRFGMTGILVIDNEPVIEQLEYSSKRLDPEWNRFVLDFEGGGTLAMNDPRRLGGVELDPDRSKFGPDAWRVTGAELVEILGRYRVAVKALLLNQQRLAGLGNLLVDELLWRCGIAPERPSNEIAPPSVRRLADELPRMLDELYERGGSNTGDLFPERGPAGHCPQDGAALTHGTVGGRSTWWCASHQH